MAKRSPSPSPLVSPCSASTPSPRPAGGASSPADRQRPPAPQDERRDAVGRAVEAQAGQPSPQQVEGHPRLEAGEVGAGTVVGAEPERQVVPDGVDVAVEPERLRLVEGKVAV